MAASPHSDAVGGAVRFVWRVGAICLARGCKQGSEAQVKLRNRCRRLRRPQRRLRRSGGRKGKKDKQTGGRSSAPAVGWGGNEAKPSPPVPPPPWGVGGFGGRSPSSYGPPRAPPPQRCCGGVPRCGTGGPPLFGYPEAVSHQPDPMGGVGSAITYLISFLIDVPDFVCYFDPHGGLGWAGPMGGISHTLCLIKCT